MVRAPAGRERGGMTPSTRRGAVVAALTTAALAAPAGAAAAPSIAVDGPCYTPGMPVGIIGSGFTPDGPVGLSFGLGGSLHGYSGTASATGQLGGAIPLPEFEQTQVDATLTAVDNAQVPPGQPPGPEQTATAAFKASEWFIAIPGWGNGHTTGAGRPGRRTALEALGFVGTASTTLYAHYVRRGRLVKTARIGALSGPCADLETRFRQFPFKTKPGATYRVVFDTTRAYPNRDGGIVYPRVKVRRSGRRAVREVRAAVADRVVGHR
jgi:hypothetical protein